MPRKKKAPETFAQLAAQVNAAPVPVDAEDVWGAEPDVDTARFKIDKAASRHFKVGVFKRATNPDLMGMWVEVFATDSITLAREYVQAEMLPEYYA